MINSEYLSCKNFHPRIPKQIKDSGDQINPWWVADFIPLHSTGKHTKTFNLLCKTIKFDDMKSQNQTSKTFMLQIVHSQCNINTLYYNTWYYHTIKSNILCLFM